jgi:hypothetical protein
MLIVDMSVAPADIAYPTDINLLNTAREKTELLIDVIYNSSDLHNVKPRTYRKTARRDYLAIAKQRNGEAIPSGKEPENNTKRSSQTTWICWTQHQNNTQTFGCYSEGIKQQ